HEKIEGAAKALLRLRFEPTLQGIAVGRCGRLEHRIAALQERACGGKAELVEHGAQLRHGQRGLAADVDAAQECDVDGHRCLFLPLGCSTHAVVTVPRVERKARVRASWTRYGVTREMPPPSVPGCASLHPGYTLYAPVGALWPLDTLGDFHYMCMQS